MSMYGSFPVCYSHQLNEYGTATTVTTCSCLRHCLLRQHPPRRIHRQTLHGTANSCSGMPETKGCGPVTCLSTCVQDTSFSASSMTWLSLYSNSLVLRCFPVSTSSTARITGFSAGTRVSQCASRPGTFFLRLT